MIGIISISVGLSIFFIAWTLLSPEKEDSGQAERNEYYNPDDDSNKVSGLIGRGARSIYQTLPGTLNKNSIEYEELEGLFRRSGNPWNIRVEEFLPTKILFTIFGFITGIVIFGFMLTMFPWIIGALMFAALGFALPSLHYKNSAAQRGNAIKKELPNAIDLIGVTIATGSTLQGAIKQITPILPDSELKKEFTILVREFDLGIPTERAVKNFANRTASEETLNFSNAIVLAQQSGADIANTLERQANSARMAHENIVEQKIAKMGGKMIMIITGLLLPAFVILLIGPMTTQLSL